MELKDKNVLVVGLGVSGVAAARFACSRGARVGITDLKTAAELGAALDALEELPIRYLLGGHPVEPFLEADLVVLSPGVPAGIEPLRRARAAGVPVVAEVELACRFLRDVLVGITGSNGKSTTTALAAHLLRGAGFEAEACGNIGSPLVDMVASTTPGRFLAVELSSFQLESIDRFRPWIGVVLNVTPDHMDRYPDLDAYKRAKLRLFRNQAAEDHVVVNADEEHAEEFAAASRAPSFRFSRLRRLHNGVCLDGSEIAWMRDGSPIPILPASELGLRGPHNLENAMAAASIALLCGAKPELVAVGLQDFRPLEHRLEPAGEIGGVLFVNDSKATNVDAAAVALRSFETPVVAIMGGRDKGGDFAALRPLAERRVRRLILIGEAAPRIAAALDGAAPAERCGSLEEAVRAGLEAAEPGDVVLLAPGCASFDMFDNFEQRGRRFKEAVGRLRDAGG